MSHEPAHHSILDWYAAALLFEAWRDVVALMLGPDHRWVVSLDRDIAYAERVIKAKESA